VTAATGDPAADPGMRFVDEYRDPDLARRLAARIAEVAPRDRHVKIMEICGGHTHAIYRFGVQGFLPANIELVHGPGCPVCVIPMGRVDDGIALAHSSDDVILTCFGDMLRVPGSNGSFLDATAAGADIRMVYSPLDALRIARENPDRQVVFYAIGFETTAPSTALTVQRAHRDGVDNFSVLCSHVTIVPPLQAILATPDLQLDAFVAPGHVSTVVGCAPYEFIAAEHGKPVVVAGFEPLDVLEAVSWIVTQLVEGRAQVENQYSRVVSWDGNPAALQAMDDVFTLRDHFEWRGLGSLPHSALRLSDRYAALDAERRFTLPGARVADPKACQCGQVLTGTVRPWECKVFGTACTPANPIGTCMVSSEGACAAYYNYGRYADRRTPVEV
jgi:hydrogenase expression/formation protein HypD